MGRRRWRFTIAHELGHWICHVLGADSLQPTYCRSQDLSQDADRALERQANVFGAELLMPESSVREQWALLGTEGAPSSMQDDAVKRVASRFDVSTSAMWYRLYSFSLVPTKPDPAS
ncbi:MAG: ImmA/IrrE family metallo-endopeptidase [Gaiella sp.]|nr:ImmA/IrrE family metallo-endopeptidase [Gaiella sp.]